MQEFWKVDFLERLGASVAIIIATWLLLRWKAKAERKWTFKGGHALGRTLTIAILITAILVVLDNFGVNIVPLIAFGGIGAAALGFAAKDVIANFFGGFMLSITHPFTVGDEILIEKEGIHGIIQDIGWYLTTVRDKDKRLLYLPNAVFSHMLVVNCSRMSHRRIYEAFCVENVEEEKLRNLVIAIREKLATVSSLDHEMPVHISLEHVSGIGPELLVELFTKKVKLAEYREVRQEVLLAILEVLRVHHVSTALPTTIFQPPKST